MNRVLRLVKGVKASTHDVREKDTESEEQRVPGGRYWYQKPGVVLG